MGERHDFIDAFLYAATENHQSSKSSNLDDVFVLRGCRCGRANCDKYAFEYSNKGWAKLYYCEPRK